jgi:hypothetical protein
VEESGEIKMYELLFCARTHMSRRGESYYYTRSRSGVTLSEKGMKGRVTQGHKKQEQQQQPVSADKSIRSCMQISNLHPVTTCTVRVSQSRTDTGTH